MRRGMHPPGDLRLEGPGKGAVRRPPGCRLVIQRGGRQEVGETGHYARRVQQRRCAGDGLALRGVEVLGQGHESGSGERVDAEALAPRAIRERAERDLSVLRGVVRADDASSDEPVPLLLERVLQRRPIVDPRAPGARRRDLARRMACDGEQAAPKLILGRRRRKHVGVERPRRKPRLDPRLGAGDPLEGRLDQRLQTAYRRSVGSGGGPGQCPGRLERVEDRERVCHGRRRRIRGGRRRRRDRHLQHSITPLLTRENRLDDRETGS